MFTIGPNKQNLQTIKEYLVQMMKKFRIEFSDVYVLHESEAELFEETYVYTTQTHNLLLATLNTIF